MDLAILAVLYATAAHGTRLVFWLGFASAIASASAQTSHPPKALPAAPVTSRPP